MLPLLFVPVPSSFWRLLRESATLKKVVFTWRVLHFLLVQRLRARPNKEGTPKKTERKRELKTQRTKNAADPLKIRKKKRYFRSRNGIKNPSRRRSSSSGLLAETSYAPARRPDAPKIASGGPRERKRQMTRGGSPVTRGARRGVQPRFGEVGGPRGVGGYNPQRELWRSNTPLGRWPGELLLLLCSFSCMGFRAW